MFNPQTEFNRMAEHLAKMAQTPGMIDQARHTCRRLEADQCGLYKGLAEAVRRAIPGRVQVSESDHHGPVKPR